MALYRHPGATGQHLRRLLADGVGAGGQRHRHGYRRGGLYQHTHTHRCFQLWTAAVSLCFFPSSPFLFLFSFLPSFLFPLPSFLPSFPEKTNNAKPQEGGRSKSHRYWPKLGSKHNSATHGKFKVTTKFRTDSGCYATTGLKVKHLLSGQERTVWHLQYTDWPEQGCPEYVQGFLCEWLLFKKCFIPSSINKKNNCFLWRLQLCESSSGLNYTFMIYCTIFLWSCSCYNK